MGMTMRPASRPTKHAASPVLGNLRDEITEIVHSQAMAYGGSISAEHGIGQMKVAELGRLGDPVALAMMRQIKTALDPQGLLNPGKLVPPIG